MEGLDINPFTQYIPASFEEVEELCSHPVYVYKHIQSGRPLGVVVGGHQGEIIGGIVYFREKNDTMNMEVQTSMGMLQGILSFIAIESVDAPQPKDSMGALWNRFVDNLLQTMSRKTGFDERGQQVPVFSQQPQPQPQSQSTPPSECFTKKRKENQEEQKNQEDPNDPDAGLCMICLDKEADTMVTPCHHNVVCSECSLLLENTGDAHICTHCRQPITGVTYPDKHTTE